MASKSEVRNSYHDRRLAKRLKDPEFRAEYDRAKNEVTQIDHIINSLDDIRENLGLSKAELARRIGKDPASVRRLFTAATNAELKTVAAIAAAMDARIEIVPAGK